MFQLLDTKYRQNGKRKKKNLGCLQRHGEKQRATERQGETAWVGLGKGWGAKQAPYDWRVRGGITQRSGSTFMTRNRETAKRK